MITDVLGGTRVGANYLNLSMDWGVEITSTQFSLTYTTECDVTSHRNPIGWGWYRGFLGSYRTLSPESMLQPSQIIGLRLAHLLTVLSDDISTGSRHLTTVNPVAYQVFFDDVAISPVRNVPTGTWDGALDCTLPVHTNAHPYRQYRVKVVCSFDIPEFDPNLRFNRCLVRYVNTVTRPAIQASYLINKSPIATPGNDFDIQRVNVQIVETGGTNTVRTTPGFETLVTELPQEKPRFVPVGANALPIQSPWYERPGGVDGAKPGVLTPTYGYWNGGEDTFFSAAINDAPNGSFLKPGNGTVWTVIPVEA